MKTGGILILTTPNLGFWISRILLLFGRQPFYLEPSLRKTIPIISYFGRSFPNDLKSLPSGHLRLYTLDMLKKLLKSYGFKTKETLGASFFVSPGLSQVDSFFSNFPSFAFGLIIKAEKYE